MKALGVERLAGGEGRAGDFRSARTGCRASKPISRLKAKSDGVPRAEAGETSRSSGSRVVVRSPSKRPGTRMGDKMGRRRRRRGALATAVDPEHEPEAAGRRQPQGEARRAARSRRRARHRGRQGKRRASSRWRGRRAGVLEAPA